MLSKKESARIKRHRRLRKKIIGTKERPRLSVHRSLANMQVQFIDDVNQKTLYTLSTSDPKIKEKIKYGGNRKAAERLGELVAEFAKSKGLERVVFDRGGYIYHGRIKAFADSAKKKGLIF